MGRGRGTQREHGGAQGAGQMGKRASVQHVHLLGVRQPPEGRVAAAGACVYNDTQRLRDDREM